MTEQEKPISLEEIKKKRVPLQNYYKARLSKLSKAERISMAISDKVGTFGFFIILFLWTAVWLLWNTFAPEHLRFDPYPAFVLWLFVSNVIQLILLPLLLIAENLQDKVAHERASADFEINIRTERELEAVFQHLEYQEKLLEKLADK